MCMKDAYLLLTCIILGHDNPKAKIDIYLQPLIDELNELWCIDLWHFNKVEFHIEGNIDVDHQWLFSLCDVG